MDKKQNSTGVPFIPRVWRGPATPVPANVRKEGISLARYGIDPAKVAKFQAFKNQK